MLLLLQQNLGFAWGGAAQDIAVVGGHFGERKKPKKRVKVITRKFRETEDEVSAPVFDMPGDVSFGLDASATVSPVGSLAGFVEIGLSADARMAPIIVPIDITINEDEDALIFAMAALLK